MRIVLLLFPSSAPPSILYFIRLEWSSSPTSRTFITPTAGSSCPTASRGSSHDGSKHAAQDAAVPRDAGGAQEAARGDDAKDYPGREAATADRRRWLLATKSAGLRATAATTVATAIPPPALRHQRVVTDPPAAGKGALRLRGTSSMPMLPPMGGEPSGAAPAEENLWDPSFLAIPKDENVFELRVTPPIPTPPPEVVNLEDMLPGWWDRAERVRPSAQKWEGNHARLASNGQRVEECLRKHPEHLDLTKGLKASTTRVARHRFIAPVLTPRKKKISVDSAFIQRPKDRYQIDLEAILEGRRLSRRRRPLHEHRIFWQPAKQPRRHEQGF